MINGLPEKLKELRVKNGYSQRAVAKQLDVSPSIISGYETGERTPSVELLLALSFLYRCSTDYLLGRENAPPPPLDTHGLSDHQLQALNEFLRSLHQ